MKSILALAAAAALALPAAAQHEEHGAPPAAAAAEHGMQQGGGGMAMPLMREIHTWRPQMLLERRELLALTERQIARLTEIGTGAQQAHDRARDEARRHFEQATEAWGAGNGDQASSHAAAGMQSMQQAHIAMLGAASAARGVLTAEQRARVAGWMDALEMQRHRMQQMREERPGTPPNGIRRPGARMRR